MQVKAAYTPEFAGDRDFEIGSLLADMLFHLRNRNVRSAQESAEELADRFGVRIYFGRPRNRRKGPANV